MVAVGATEKRPIGHTVEVLKEVPSTNTLILGDLNLLENHGLVLRALHQTAGRGQQGKRWASLPGKQLQVSIVAHLHNHTERLPLVSLLAGVAVVEAIEDSLSLRPELKWPNDVLVKKRKVCGILVENNPSRGLPRLVIGIGLNCNGTPRQFPPPLRPLLTTLAHEAKQEPSQEAILETLLGRLQYWWDVLETDPKGDVQVISAWEKRARVMGRRVWVESTGTSRSGGSGGRVDGLTEEGYLRIRLDNGEVITHLSSTLEWLD